MALYWPPSIGNQQLEMDALLTQFAAHGELLKHQQRLKHSKLTTLFQQDPQRFQRYSLNAAGWMADFSKQPLDAELLKSLITLAQQAEVPEQIKAMAAGAKLNNTEDRSAWHIALRSEVPNRPVEVKQTLAKINALSAQFRNGELHNQHGQILDQIVHIGIGGSYLGPRLIIEALSPCSDKAFTCRFLSNIDGLNVHNALNGLDPARTLVIIASKSFGTLETLENARAVKQWLVQAGLDPSYHCYALSSNIAATQQFGIDAEKVLPLWDWVGGRYSLWSAIGLPISLALGNTLFEQLLSGAAEMDQHFMQAPLAQNTPVMMALIGIWHINYQQRDQHAVLAYHHGLRNLAPYLQQLEMESNGKGVNQAGTILDYATAPTVWGGEGTNGQHAYHQLLHQGSSVIPCDFITSVNNQHNHLDHQAWLYANCLSQSQVLMQGTSSDEVAQQLQQQGSSNAQIAQLQHHKAMPGNRPSSTLVCEQLTAQNLGALIALYEHKVFCQGRIWGINSFDQWGVELGKKIGEQIYNLIQQPSDNAATDASTQGLLQYYQQHNNYRQNHS